jgi:radical SAM protein with 4Fe4S-binding SPASM domain
MEHLVPLVAFVKDTFDFQHLSMNMIIRTGIARDNDSVEITYAEVAELLPPVISHCESIGIRPVWYSPTPYCLFNPVDHNLGSKSCACVSGLLSVSPTGEILPCSSFSRGIGSLLTRSFESIWQSDEALYWRERRYKPPVCRGCEFEELCGGGCPLYWEHAGSFKEIETVRECSPKFKNAWWSVERALRTRSRGTTGLNSARR